jgi:hypothetical protein
MKPIFVGLLPQNKECEIVIGVSFPKNFQGLSFGRKKTWICNLPNYLRITLKITLDEGSYLCNNN